MLNLSRPKSAITLMVVALLLLCLVVALPANLLAANLYAHTATITGTAAKVALSATDTRCYSVTIKAQATNSALIRFGDTNTSSTVGEDIPAGAAHYLEMKSNGDVYVLSAWYVYAAVGDKVIITCVNNNP